MTGNRPSETILPEERAAKVINDLISERNELRLKVARLESENRRLRARPLTTTRSTDEFGTDD